MSPDAARSPATHPLTAGAGTLRVAFLGSEAWIAGCAPAAPMRGLEARLFSAPSFEDCELLEARIAGFRPHVTVIFDPFGWPLRDLGSALGITLGVLVEQGVDPSAFLPAFPVDRLVCFEPALSGAELAGRRIWRAIPPPVSDSVFMEVRRCHGAPRAITIGRSTTHREAMLLPAKHRYDLLQVIHGVSGESLRELLAECDVGVYVSAEPGGRFAQQVGVHLAAGQLLLAEPLTPGHGLERNLDYLQITSPHELVWILERLTRFPEMHHRVRVRGRLKAEHCRASRLFSRVIHDLLLDIQAFGPGTGVAA